EPSLRRCTAILLHRSVRVTTVTANRGHGVALQSFLNQRLIGGLRSNDAVDDASVLRNAAGDSDRTGERKTLRGQERTRSWLTEVTRLLGGTLSQPATARARAV